jgi:DNA-binding FadR family transcriptional regulator
VKIVTDPKELLILELVSESKIPLGSWNLVEQLEQKGISVSPATIGRILNHLEKNGYLSKRKFQGRVITSKGEEAIQKSHQAQNVAIHQKTIEKYINSDVLQNYIMVLEARKAIERTTAYLAATHVTDAEIARLETILNRQRVKHDKTQSIAQDDIDFHRTIAAASRNDVLESLYVIVSLMGQQSELFEYIRRKVGAPYMVSHRNIFEAICSHDPEAAEQAMLHHIDSLCMDVNTYWHEYYRQK